MYREENDYELIYMISENEDAKEMFFEKYRPFIISKAKSFYPSIKNRGYELNDLVQEGMVGLSQAIDDFKEQKNVKFASFASVCIERQMITFVRDANRKKHRLLNGSLSIDSDTDKRGTPLMEVIFDDKNGNPEDSFVNTESEDEMLSKIKEILTDKEFEVFELRFHGFTYQEMACLLGVTVKSIDGSIRRIKSKLTNFDKHID